jgi:hypothetical protein
LLASWLFRSCGTSIRQIVSGKGHIEVLPDFRKIPGHVADISQDTYEERFVGVIESAFKQADGVIQLSCAL